ncbi:methyltransferase family protein [Actinoalloteichus hymeniacidonis]|uniref:Methyltransferase family protein n=2 Tax=Actinoalloteichus hymeniacidonis TaxID=340345 RepID=A0AAC9HR08_9PSEU|nr:methyltransferase family protein [Actinoalloteichus hymeniacidonis]
MLAANRANWDARVPIHLTGYDLASLRSGGARLAPFELAEMGPIAGRRIAHLQCHLGTDTIDLARRDAVVRALDFSEAAVHAARELAVDCAVDIEYVHGDVYDSVELLGAGSTDIVYTGKGSLCWLPDLAQWAQAAAGLLRPGGFLYLVEFHPLFIAAADAQPGAGLSTDFPYLSTGTAFRFDDGGTYEGEGRRIVDPASAVSFEWSHDLGEVVSALAAAGFRIRTLTEHALSPWQRWPEQQALEGHSGWWHWEREGFPLPAVYSVRAEWDPIH